MVNCGGQKIQLHDDRRNNQEGATFGLEGFSEIVSEFLSVRQIEENVSVERQLLGERRRHRFVPSRFEGVRGVVRRSENSPSADLWQRADCRRFHPGNSASAFGSRASSWLSLV